jgi:hypothetical protein
MQFCLFGLKEVVITQYFIATLVESSLMGLRVSWRKDFRCLISCFDPLHKNPVDHLNANVSAKNDHGVTPLHVAAMCGNKEIAEVLIADGPGEAPIHSSLLHLMAGA